MGKNNNIRVYNDVGVCIISVIAAALAAVVCNIYQYIQLYNSPYFDYKAVNTEPFPWVSVLLTGAIIALVVFWHFKKSVFLLVAIVFYLISMFYSNSSMLGISSIIICALIYFYSRKDNELNEHKLDEKFIPSVLIIIYLFYLFGNIGLFMGFFNSLVAGASGLYVFLHMIRIIAFISAPVLMLLATKKKVMNLYRVAAGLFLAGMVFLIGLLGFDLTSAKLILVPEVILSLYVLTQKKQKPNEYIFGQTSKSLPEEVGEKQTSSDRLLNDDRMALFIRLLVIFVIAVTLIWGISANSNAPDTYDDYSKISPDAETLTETAWGFEGVYVFAIEVQEYPGDVLEAGRYHFYIDSISIEPGEIKQGYEPGTWDIYVSNRYYSDTEIPNDSVLAASVGGIDQTSADIDLYSGQYIYIKTRDAIGERMGYISITLDY